MLGSRNFLSLEIQFLISNINGDGAENIGQCITRIGSLWTQLVSLLKSSGCEVYTTVRRTTDSLSKMGAPPALPFLLHAPLSMQPYCCFLFLLLGLLMFVCLSVLLVSGLAGVIEDIDMSDYAAPQKLAAALGNLKLDTVVHVAGYFTTEGPLKDLNRQEVAPQILP